jgi:hypothetical protein
MALHVLFTAEIDLEKISPAMSFGVLTYGAVMCR